MTAMEYSAVTDDQMSQIQQWVMSHDATVKYIAVIMTLLVVVEVATALGVLPL